METLLSLVLFSVILVAVRGLEVVPTSPEGSGPFIWYTANNATSTSYWTNKLDEFLKPYIQFLDSKESVANCRTGELPKTESRCVQDVTNWHPCTSSNGYNYNSSFGGPCIFLKLTNLDGWEPIYYNASTIPTSVPAYLRDLIYSIEHRSGPGTEELKFVWLTCNGEYPADIENIGPLTYLPYMGFESNYLSDGHLSPIVAIYFEKPTRGVLINVECQAWAKNINDGDQSRGYVRFEFLID